MNGRQPSSRAPKKDRIIELQARLLRRAGDSGEEGGIVTLEEEGEHPTVEEEVHRDRG